MSLALDVQAMDGVAIIGTLGFFVPAAILLSLVVIAVVRDRRLSAQEEAEETAEQARSREALGDSEDIRPRQPGKTRTGTPPADPV